MQRYDARLVEDVCGNKDIVMRECHDGLFVRHADAEQELERLREIVREYRDGRGHEDCADLTEGSHPHDYRCSTCKKADEVCK